MLQARISLVVGGGHCWEYCCQHNSHSQQQAALVGALQTGPGLGHHIMGGGLRLCSVVLLVPPYLLFSLELPQGGQIKP
jgi:hypothetical protein